MISLGGPVEGAEFYDRKKVLSELRRGIPHANYALSGPRRLGKSSILKELKRGGVEGFIPVEINIAKVVPTEPKYVLREIGKKTLEAVMREKGLLGKMPEFIGAKLAQLSDFIHENLRIKVSDWLTLYFEESADLTPLLEKTFSTIEALDERPLIMLDEITSLIRLKGAAPNPRDMQFMWALGNYIPEAKNARYVVSGSQTGLMEMLLTKETAPFLGRFVMMDIHGLEDSGAEKLIREKIGKGVSSAFIAELKKRTKFWPLYLQAYCFAVRCTRAKKVDELDEDVFRILYGHFLYLDGLLTDDERRALLGIAQFNTCSTRELSKKIGIRYDSIETAFRRLKLKGFVKKIGPATYEPLDHMFKEWLKREYLTGK